ncbi:hypothetical protein DSM106972_089650 [Dulcicalothrix desertica PCC 7102]|uniref:Uncharacterized protein n=1 Tax=Dulcicalothrix desertica PCC 7102 TaxID=232991 RepID=A0A433UP43_9CYAN|nr:DUF4258 domain-containing protein [Dulcicalothrix desertica]RUS95609.1 hypothetical protein DSM106972_089650 [Dulcicalothrix desertica PCC 7102]TWH39944.1 hypothetical protein CAL7102_09224 [Dulcicalothrix desertica PCC 7102]
MNSKKRLSLIFEKDEKKAKIYTLRIAPKHKDSTHVQRRQQQRAISEAMIKIALLYGQKKYRYGAQLFTLNDRNLDNSPYSQYKDTLRGLRVVCLSGLPNPQILTVYWDKEIKNRVRK